VRAPSRLAVQLGMTRSARCRARACGRGRGGSSEDVASSIAWQTPDGGRLCRSRHGEPGKLAGAERSSPSPRAPDSSISRRKWGDRSPRAYVSSRPWPRLGSVMLAPWSLVENCAAVESRLPKPVTSAFEARRLGSEQARSGLRAPRSGDAVETTATSSSSRRRATAAAPGSSTYGGSCASSTAKAWAPAGARSSRSRARERRSGGGAGRWSRRGTRQSRDAAADWSDLWCELDAALVGLLERAALALAR